MSYLLSKHTALSVCSPDEVRCSDLSCTVGKRCNFVEDCFLKWDEMNCGKMFLSKNYLPQPESVCCSEGSKFGRVVILKVQYHEYGILEQNKIVFHVYRVQTKILCSDYGTLQIPKLPNFEPLEKQIVTTITTRHSSQISIKKQPKNVFISFHSFDFCFEFLFRFIS